MTSYYNDLHCHLHGCLTAPDVHSLGASIWKSRLTALNWYADEYQKACGTRPDPKVYWESQNGLQRLRQDFEMTTPGDFAQFQARFNLIIALFPLSSGDTSILQHVLNKDLQSNTLGHREYRLFIPPRFAKEEVYQYVDVNSEVVRDFSSRHAERPSFRLAFSLSRNVDLLKMQYATLKEWQKSSATKELKESFPKSTFVSGIDFCGEEAGCPPAKLETFFKKVLTDNQEDPDSALAILYHVGEQWHNIPPGLAIQWVADAAQMGVHRLGHALAIRIDAETLAQAPTNDHGLSTKQIEHLQERVIRQLKDTNAIVEVCPTSNRIISKGASTVDMLRPLVEHNINTVIGTDNPGIHNITLESEWKSIQNEKLQKDCQINLDANNVKFLSGVLAGRR